ncbi:unnamed protein product [Macrosiphum euphorbiae]|uniref:BEN domain-containing protein n=1 Tax=Macrosiphum euphorbiae TaxID=13131 RepID=A0AAV0WEJ1_9HEMI|nr:unnamed protein product [Macrosiphum euphorbiae]
MCPDESDDDDNGLNFKILPLYKEVVSTPSFTQEPINCGASTSTVTKPFCAEINREETVHYTELMPKIVGQIEYPQNHNFVEDTSCFIPITHDSPLNFNGYDRCSSQVDEKLNNIISEQIAIKLLLNRILSKLETNTLSNNSQKSIDLDGSFVYKFPMKNTEEFGSVQNCILHEFDFKAKLAKYFIKNIGGNTPKNHVSRGRNISTKIGDSDLIKIMKKSIQESCTNTAMTDSEFEKVVSEWLRHANTRCSRQTN